MRWATAARMVWCNGTRCRTSQRSQGQGDILFNALAYPAFGGMRQDHAKTFVAQRKNPWSGDIALKVLSQWKCAFTPYGWCIQTYYPCPYTRGVADVGYHDSAKLLSRIYPHIANASLGGRVVLVCYVNTLIEMIVVPENRTSIELQSWWTLYTKCNSKSPSQGVDSGHIPFWLNGTQYTVYGLAKEDNADLGYYCLRFKPF
jgi:hypothetical protein